MVFEWVEVSSKFNADFKDSYNEEGDERYFLESDIHYHENLQKSQNDLLFLP